MSTFTVLVAEDEPLGLATVVNLLRRDSEIAGITPCANAQCVRDALSRQTFDIAFLDIEMPGASGIDLAETMRASGPLVVFVTAFPGYAPSAFDVNAVDYVLKPFSDDRFVAALTRVKRRVRERRLGALAGQLATVSAEITHTPVAPHSTHLQKIPVRSGDRAVLLGVADVIWIEADDYYVKVHARSGRHLIRATLASLVDRLDPASFQRVHRTAVVNVAEVVEVREEERLILVMSNGDRVPVSRSRRSLVEPIVVPRLRPGR